MLGLLGEPGCWTIAFVYKNPKGTPTCEAQQSQNYTKPMHDSSVVMLTCLSGLTYASFASICDQMAVGNALLDVLWQHSSV